MLWKHSAGKGRLMSVGICLFQSNEDSGHPVNIHVNETISQISWDGEMEAHIWPDIYEANDQKKNMPA